MKAIMLSIQPKYCELIASGKKTIEVRKTRPKLTPPFTGYIYETKGICDTPTFIDEDGHCSYRGRGKVIGEFVCDRIDEYAYDVYDGVNIDDDDLLETCLDREEINIYAKGKPLYGIHITDLKIYDTPKFLGEFRSICAKKRCTGKNCDCYDEEYEGCHRYTVLTHAPQSWCYVEEI